MAERSHHHRLKTIGRSSSTESTEYSLTMGRSVSKKKKKPKERWLLTRKTWRYMADAGRKLIPDGVQNRPEDIPKIEAYFQEVCKKEPKFLLWRKNSYPGALGFRKKRKGPHQQKGGSCRKACSADQVDPDIKLERPKDLTLVPSGSGRFDLQKLKYDFLNKPPSPVNYLPGVTQKENQEEQLLNMLEQYLNLTEQSKDVDFKYQDLIDRLQKHLNLVGHNYQAFPNYPTGSVHFQGDHVQKSLYETLNRYFSQSTSREKIISDLLTDRKALEKLYFELRKTKGFRGSRGGTGYQHSSSSSNYGKTKSTTDGGYHYKKFEFSSPPPLIEIESETPEIVYHDWATQTVTIPENLLNEIEEKYKKSLEKQDEEERRENRPTVRRRSSVDNDDVSQSVSDTIKRYLRMARKKSVDTDKVDRFKRVNYDRNLRNIKPKGEITKPGDDDGLHKGCQTDDDWILRYRDLKFEQYYDNDHDESRLSSSRSSIDHSNFYDNDNNNNNNNNNTNKSSPTSPPSTTKSHSFLSHLLHGGKHDKSNPSAVTTTTTSNSGSAGGGSSSGTTNNASASVVQKSKSSSSVMHHGSRLMAKKIFKSRSKSQTRPTQAACSWTPQGGCTWTNLTGRQVVLNDTKLVHLTDIERKVLQKVALAKLQALNLGVAVKVPSDAVSSTGAVSKPKRRPYLLKRKAITTTIFDTNRKDSGDKDGSTGGLVFGIPLTQCVENDRLSRTALRTTSGHNSNNNNEEAVIGRHDSRSSFSSLIDNNTRVGDEGGSCENLLSRERIIGSVPGQLDRLSSSSTADLITTTTPINTGIVNEGESAVPNILNECFRHLQQHGLHTLGIFRVSTSKKRIRQLREDFDCGKETTLDEDQCPHDVATLLKEYLRDLPDPLLCRELYHAFVQTQRIRNRRLQLEALQHLIQLLPPANRDTLYALLSFLSLVAKNADDSTNESGEFITGNRMDSNNLATVFAPNILHCIKPGASKDITNDPRPEDRIDIINVVRTLIDHYQNLFTISAELLDEIYVHMMDSHPDVLDQLLNKKDAIAAAADESVEEVDSESYSAPWSPTENYPVIEERKRTYSREECLHEAAATGGPNISMRIRHRDKSNRRKRDESANRRYSRNKDDGISSSINIISRIRGQKDDDYHYNKTRSSSIESTSSTHTDSDLARIQTRNQTMNDERRKSSPYLLDNSGVITASLTIPVQPLNVDDDIPYIEDAESGRQQLTIGLVRNTSGIPSVPPRRRQRSISGSDSSISGLPPVITQYDSAVGSSMTQSSTADVGTFSSPPSWGSTPPTSPDSHTSTNYIPEDQLGNKLQKQIVQKTSPILQKVSFSSTQEIQQVRQKVQNTEIHKSFSATSFEPKFTPSITNIGGAVLRSKTEDFERITKTESKSKTTTTTTTTTTASSDKKKYTKRRYTDSRHPTRHIPDSETLENRNNQEVKEDKCVTSQQTGPVYKRRELISSVPSK